VAITYKIGVSQATYKSLKKLAALSDDPTDLGAMVTKLVDYWHNGAPSESELPPAEPKEFVQLLPGQAWRSPRGDLFLIGLQLRAQYLGNTYSAQVTINGIDFAGKTYDSPSAAAIAVKEATGKSGAGANTNGWDFWEMPDSKTGQWVSIATLKAGQK
jgi:hypothetical protein